MQIIDAHCHWLPEKILLNAHFFHKGWSDIPRHIAIMQQYGISKSVLTYPTSDAHLKLGGIKKVAHIFNDSIAEITNRYPEYFLGAAVLPVDNTQAILEEYKRTKELGFKAISLASSYDKVYLDDKRFLPLYEKVLQDGIPIFVHPQIVEPIGWERLQDPLLTPVIEYIFDTTVCVGRILMAGILEEFQGIKFIFSSFGGVIPFLAGRFDATYQMLRGINFVKDLKANPTEYLRRIYVDTSGETNHLNLELALDFFGSGHLLWGSDWPAKGNPEISISAIHNLDIDEEEKKCILGANLINILKGVV